ncbi:MAG: tRNA (adenosine(37)-N6)-threonylcarbamoyltransferase complex ATPase subunit type 1 TsaE [Cellvibrionaceae bacterium]|nr:tRNA (adenosine(37)-N6)-threonylcarbamoyltransferase complex ATPase subunit type 1 TsaE [Cellvibrionaceae bacterium]
MWIAHLPDENSTVAAGYKLGGLLPRELCVVSLEGCLGAGKTTFCRGLLSRFGYSGAVKSPTYTLVEPYRLSDWTIYHFDLYRLADPEELEFVGVRDYFADEATCLVEWPERGEGFIPVPDIVVSLQLAEPGRQITVTSKTARGAKILTRLKGDAFES